MYKSHQPLISRWAREDSENLRDVMQFVILTVRCPLRRAVGDLHALRSPNDNERDDTERSALWGWKHEAYSYVEANHEHIHAHLEDLWASSGKPSVVEDAMLAYVSSLPGFGMVKAGFVLQIAYGISGCLDSHNVRRYGLDANAIGAKKAKVKRPVTRMKHVRNYRRMVETLGGTEALWDTWCAYVAENQPNSYSSAEQVSALHAHAFELI